MTNYEITKWDFFGIFNLNIQLNTVILCSNYSNKSDIAYDS